MLTHLRRGAEDLDAHAVVTDVTSGHAQLNVQGPRSRELLQPLTSADLSNEAFPFRTAREIDLGFARVLCIRVTYVGELGYELYIPAEQALHVYDRLTAAGAAVEPPPCRSEGAGQPADGEGLPRLRPRHRQHRPGARRRPGLLRGASTSRAASSGATRWRAAKAAGPPTRRLVQVLVTDPEPLLFHAEVVHRDGQPVGYVRSASYGHTLGGAVGLAMVEAGRKVDQAYLDDGTWEVEIAGRRYPAIASLKPLYDPEMKRVRS